MLNNLRLVVLTIAFMALATAAQGQQKTETFQEKLGYPSTARLLIIHADDFGMMHSINQAISLALENGWVTSASLMVPCPWYPEVVTWAHSHPNADLGIHLVLNSEWPGIRWGPTAPRDDVASLLDPDGYFFNDPSLFTHVKMTQVETELRAQIDKAQSQGLHISHLDSHMIALIGSRHLFDIYERLSSEYDLPIPLTTVGDYQMPAGAVPPQHALMLDKVITMNPGIPKRDWVKWYEKSLASLKPGIYELIVHLAYDDPEMRAATRNHPDWGAAWRQQDLDMVRSPQFRKFLRDQKFVLVTWRQLSDAYAKHALAHD